MWVAWSLCSGQWGQSWTLKGWLGFGGCLAPPGVQYLDPKELKGHQDREEVKGLQLFSKTSCGQRGASEPLLSHLGNADAPPGTPSPGGKYSWGQAAQDREEEGVPKLTRKLDHRVPPAECLARGLFLLT